LYFYLSRNVNYFLQRMCWPSYGKLWRGRCYICH